MPQSPQLLGSVVGSTHAVPHNLSPVAQVRVHEPAEQTFPPVHIVPQAPQLFGSLARSAHVPEQSTFEPVHPHFPPAHVSAAVHAVPHALQLS